jgi:hypothetical protein
VQCTSACRLFNPSFATLHADIGVFQYWTADSIAVLVSVNQLGKKCRDATLAWPDGSLLCSVVGVLIHVTLNPVLTLPPDFVNIHFNIILSPAASSNDNFDISHLSVRDSCPARLFFLLIIVLLSSQTEASQYAILSGLLSLHSLRCKLSVVTSSSEVQTFCCHFILQTVATSSSEVQIFCCHFILWGANFLSSLHPANCCHFIFWGANFVSSLHPLRCKLSVVTSSCKLLSLHPLRCKLSVVTSSCKLSLHPLRCRFSVVTSSWKLLSLHPLRCKLCVVTSSCKLSSLHPLRCKLSVKQFLTLLPPSSGRSAVRTCETSAYF